MEKGAPAKGEPLVLPHPLVLVNQSHTFDTFHRSNYKKHSANETDAEKKKLHTEKAPGTLAEAINVLSKNYEFPQNSPVIVMTAATDRPCCFLLQARVRYTRCVPCTPNTSACMLRTSGLVADFHFQSFLWMYSFCGEYVFQGSCGTF